MHPRKIVALALSGRARKIGGMEPSAAASNPDRASAAAVDRQAAMVLRDGLLEQLYDAMSEFVLVLNDRRQVVFCNRSWSQFIGARDRRELYGRRPGELMGWLARRRAGAAGAARRAPSAARSRRTSALEHGREDVRETRIIRGHPPEALELLVRTTPLVLEGQTFTIAALTDISHEKRRRALERIFFHDVLNTVASVRLFADILLRAEPGKVPEMAGRIDHGVRRLAEEISSQRDLMAAEGNELPVRPITVHSRELLQQVLDNYAELAVPRRCQLQLHADAPDPTLHADITILSACWETWSRTPSRPPARAR